MHTSKSADGQLPRIASARIGRALQRRWAKAGDRWAPGLFVVSFLSGLVCAQATTGALASQPPGAVAQAVPPSPPASGAPRPSSGATLSQPITVQAGTGVLLRLPQPAATVMSAEPSVARVQPASPTSLFLMGVAPGRTTVIATTDAGVAIVQYDVTVAPGAGGAVPLGAPAAATGVSPATARAIQAAIAGTVQGASAVRVQAAGNDVILTGTVPNAAAAQQSEAIARAYLGEKVPIVDNLTVLGAIQVNVRVRIAEIDRSITRQLGINWQALGTIGSIGRFPATTLNLPGTVAGTTTALATAACASSMLGGAIVPPAGLLSVQCQGINFNGIIDALAQDQLATLLAEPNLTVLSGETASFLVGGEFPVPTTGSPSNGTIQVTVEYKAFGVSLTMGISNSAVAHPDQFARAARGQSALDQRCGQHSDRQRDTDDPRTNCVRRAETTVELGSGQSFAIAGLLQKTSVNADNALPQVWASFQSLGALFKSPNGVFQRGESELVIIVTPYIVQPVSNPSTLRTPVDAFRPATDLDRILLGRQLAPPVGGGAPVDAGFILK